MHHGIVLDALIFLVIAVLAPPICHRLRVTPVLGYMVAGAVVGPFGLALIQGGDGTRDLGELGIVFLMFMIGLELSWERLKVIRHFIFGLGTAQVVVTGALASVAVALSGMPSQGALVIGLALAFSSTAFVLQILSERGELNSQTGRVAVAVLILQDLAVVPLLVMIPLMGGDGWAMASALLLALVKAVGAMVTIFVVARLALRPLFHAVASTRAPEVFVAAALLAAVGTSFATNAIGLSHTLGAFLAGAMLASTEYRHQVEADILPIRGLLMGLFFMTVGMTMDPLGLAANLPALVSGVALLLAGKTLVVALLALGFGFPLATALHLGLLLAQGGEFAFVVLGQATEVGLITAANAASVTAVVAVSMALTPVLAALGDWVARHRRMADGRALAPGDHAHDLKDHVVVVGCGRVGQIITAILRERDEPFIAIDRDPRLVARLRGNKDLPVYFGDVRKVEVLKAVGAHRARALVLTIDGGSSREKLVPRLRQHFPQLHILVRARDRRQARDLEARGATAVVPEAMEASLQLAGLTLRQLGLPMEEVHALLDTYRRSDYAALDLTVD